MAGNGSEEELTLAGTPTWIVAVVCTTIILISLVFERFLHHVGKVLIRKNQKPLFEALQTMKGELMLMGLISLLLVVFQGAIQKICIPVSYSRHLRPCRGEDLTAEGEVSGDDAAHRGRLLLSAAGSEHCQRQGKIPLLSIEAIHDLHIFIFALASTHVFLSVKTIALAGAKIHKWKFCEVSIHEEAPEDASVSSRIASAHGIKSNCYQHRRGFGKCSVVVTWAHYFLMQFFSTLTTSEYRAMRLGFIMAHCNGNLRFDFYSYLLRALEEDYKKVVGLRSADTPMEVNHHLGKDYGELIEDVTEYQRMVGRLLYLSHTRPGIAYAVGVINQCMHAPKKNHLNAVHQILRNIWMLMVFCIRHRSDNGREYANSSLQEYLAAHGILHQTS